ncbi:uncharacterized protein SCDLUD_005011 [Saccharomycodes ludwigii]|uniref:uncharacterized protein n=1 Tax=Saccharomycodes ludwigii TaxID=36035 RepID=UPI001E8BA31D|nr:hypothetical protein SCDLUD_005011 [Saccharomycodes ludwigii]KAH3898688.1 hypothetical protein SCDLUD_005011 [Saccharomycodes ludwigii]
MNQIENVRKTIHDWDDEEEEQDDASENQDCSSNDCQDDEGQDPAYNTVSSPPLYVANKIIEKENIKKMNTQYSHDKNHMKDKALKQYNKASNSALQAILPLGEVMKTENFHLLINSLLFSSNVNNCRSISKIQPFAIYSFLNITNFICYELFPDSPISEAFKPILTLLRGPLMKLNSFIDILNFGVILYQDTQYKTGYYIFIIYCFVWILRLEYNENSRVALNKLVSFIDLFIGEQLYQFLCLVANPTTERMYNCNYNGEKKKGNTAKNEGGNKLGLPFIFKIFDIVIKLWFKYIRHGINIILPLNSVSPTIKDPESPLLLKYINDASAYKKIKYTNEDSSKSDKKLTY